MYFVRPEDALKAHLDDNDDHDYDPHWDDHLHGDGKVPPLSI